MDELQLAIKARDLAIKALSKVLGKKASEILKLAEEDTDGKLVDDVIDTLDGLEAQHIADGKKALKGELAKALKKNGFTDQIDKFDDAFVGKLKETFKSDSSEPGDESEKVKALTDEVRTLKKQVADKETEIADKVAEAEKKFKQQIIQQGMPAKIREILKEINAKEPEDGEKANNKLDKMMRGEGLNSRNWEYDQKRKDYIAVDEDGNPVREGGNVVTLKNIITTSAEFYYDIQAAEKKDDGGLPNNKGGAGGSGGASTFKFEKYKGDVPKTIDDVYKILDDPMGDIEAQAEVQVYWETVGSKDSVK